MSKLFSPPALQHLAKVLKDSDAIHEHTAIHAVPNLRENAATLKSCGHDLILEVHDVAIFMQKGTHRIELINAKDAPEHEAWLVPTVEGLHKLHDAFLRSRNFHWLEIYRFDLPSLVTRMYRYKNSDACVQIVWRQTVFYEGLSS